MATDINTVAVSGRLAADAEFRQFNDGGIINFSIAVNRSQKGQDGQYTDVASFFDVSYSSKGAGSFVQYLKKGTKVMISGYLTQDRWQDKQTGQNRTAIRIRANDVVLATSGTQQMGQQQPQQHQQPMQQGFQQQMPQGVTQGFSQQQPVQQQYIQQNYQAQQYQQGSPVSMGGFLEDIAF